MGREDLLVRVLEELKWLAKGADSWEEMRILGALAEVAVVFSVKVPESGGKAPSVDDLVEAIKAELGSLVVSQSLLLQAFAALRGWLGR